jgi:hypothetical protein
MHYSVPPPLTSISKTCTYLEPLNRDSRHRQLDTASDADTSATHSQGVGDLIQPRGQFEVGCLCGRQ